MPDVSKRLSRDLNRVFDPLDAVLASGRDPGAGVPIPSHRLARGLAAIPGPIAEITEISGLTSFDVTGYTRLRLRRTPTYEALLLCWLRGQQSPIHDHAGAQCAFRVVEGEAVETQFLRRGLEIEEGTRTVLATGSISSADLDDIHQLGCQRGDRLVTFHLYSPALPRIRTYRRTLIPTEDAA